MRFHKLISHLVSKHVRAEADEVRFSDFNRSETDFKNKTQMAELFKGGKQGAILLLTQNTGEREPEFKPRN